MDSWNKMNQWKQMMDQFMGDNFWKNFNMEQLLGNKQEPTVNVYEAGNEVLCVINLPGLRDVKNVELYVEYQQLIVRGHNSLKFSRFRPLNEEIFQGSFERSINLPFPVREKPIDASYKKGLLIIHLHRLMSETPQKRIPIQNHDQPTELKKKK
ncbi:Hsp20/alpha crystallin family protein [Bacillus taeanensis]|uniref:Hsp20/alpha crystallin family protein n=1 Tax=Bacillus taeanensis TaxID=273032 RepID=UPI0015F08F67|nr:Hsp20/alpha crystallin family protein [Bacillus taeanensis]